MKFPSGFELICSQSKEELKKSPPCSCELELGISSKVTDITKQKKWKKKKSSKAKNHLPCYLFGGLNLFKQ